MPYVQGTDFKLVHTIVGRSLEAGCCSVPGNCQLYNHSMGCMKVSSVAMCCNGLPVVMCKSFTLRCEM